MIVFAQAIYHFLSLLSDDCLVYIISGFKFVLRNQIIEQIFNSKTFKLILQVINGFLDVYHKTLEIRKVFLVLWLKQLVNHEINAKFAAFLTKKTCVSHNKFGCSILKQPLTMQHDAKLIDDIRRLMIIVICLTIQFFSAALNLREINLLDLAERALDPCGKWLILPHRWRKCFIYWVNPVICY